MSASAKDVSEQMFGKFEQWIKTQPQIIIDSMLPIIKFLMESNADMASIDGLKIRYMIKMVGNDKGFAFESPMLKIMNIELAPLGETTEKPPTIQ